MPSLIYRMLFIFGLMFVFTTFRSLFSGLTTSNKIEKPGILERIALGAQVVVTLLMAFMLFVGILMSDSEMVIVSSVVLVIFAILLFGIRRKFKRFYEENDESFYLDQQYVVDRVYYENITDWMPLRKRIGVLDPTQSDVYVVVNFAFHDPEILLSHLAEMTFAGRFKGTEGSTAEDPNREQQFIDHLQKNGYGHIVDEYTNRMNLENEN